MAVITGLVAYWSLDEASGNAIDAHGSNDLTETSGTIGTASGARQFVIGDTEYFTVTDTPDLSTGDIDYSLQFWVNLTSLPGGAKYALGSKGNGDGTVNDEWRVTVEEFGGDMYWTFVINNSAANKQVSSGVVSTGTWIHVLVYHDSVNNEIGISINNAARATTPYSGGATDGTDNFHIGSVPVLSWYFNGLIADVGFWKNKVLAVDEGTWLYNSGTRRTYADIVAEGGGPTLTLVGRSVLDYGAD